MNIYTVCFLIWLRGFVVGMRLANEEERYLPAWMFEPEYAPVKLWRVPRVVMVRAWWPVRFEFGEFDYQALRDGWRSGDGAPVDVHVSPGGRRVRSRWHGVR